MTVAFSGLDKLATSFSRARAGAEALAISAGGLVTSAGASALRGLTAGLKDGPEGLAVRTLEHLQGPGTSEAQLKFRSLHNTLTIRA